MLRLLGAGANWAHVESTQHQHLSDKKTSPLPHPARDEILLVPSEYHAGTGILGNLGTTTLSRSQSPTARFLCKGFKGQPWPTQVSAGVCQEARTAWISFTPSKPWMLLPFITKKVTAATQTSRTVITATTPWWQQGQCSSCGLRLCWQSTCIHIEPHAYIYIYKYKLNTLAQQIKCKCAKKMSMSRCGILFAYTSTHLYRGCSCRSRRISHIGHMKSLPGRCSLCWWDVNRPKPWIWPSLTSLLGKVFWQCGYGGKD